MRKAKLFKIIKRSGTTVDFDRQKLRNSLLKSGAEQRIVNDVLQSIEESLYEGITTNQIYRLAFRLLKKASSSHAARYNLRAAIRHLGPAGFFFEKYIARLYAFEKFETRTNLFLQGRCVTHEIDIAIRKNNVVEMVECKFHNGPEANSDVKVPMYILSRFNDLKDDYFDIFGRKEQLHECRIVTNNRFTSDAIKFADCSGLKLLSWDYPANGGLKTKIDHNGLYPVTCLTTLSMVEKEKLLILDIIMAGDLMSNNNALARIGLSANRIKNVLKEAAELANIL